MLDELWAQVRKAVEAEIETAGREVAEELDELVRVRAARRTKTKGLAAAQDDVDSVDHDLHCRGSPQVWGVDDAPVERDGS